MRVKCINNWLYEHLIKVGEIYNVAEYSYGYEIRPGIVMTKNKFEIIKEDKMEEVRVIRKLEELNGLENGMGLHLNYNELNKHIQIYTEKELKMETRDLDFLKAMGFKFKFQKLRTAEEVIEEMKGMESLEFNINGNNFFIAKSHGSYYVENHNSIDILGAIYMARETATKYVAELNEIIGVGNGKIY